MTELEEYATQIPAPVDSISVQNVMLYLKACHKMFERGILEKKGFIKTVNSLLLASIKDGFRFFSEWADKVTEEGMHMYSNLALINTNEHLVNTVSVTHLH